MNFTTTKQVHKIKVNPSDDQFKGMYLTLNIIKGGEF